MAQSEHKSRGALMVIEGLDRAGKSTQCERLCGGLEKEGRTIKRIRFPDRTTPIGKSIDNYLKGETQIEDHVIHLLFAANRWEAAGGIRDAVAQGITVVVDRYSYSGAVYSAAKKNPSLSLDWAWQQETGLPQPDVCIFLDIDGETAEQRGGFGSERYETQQMQKNVREMFEQLRSLPCGDVIRVVDAGRSLEEVGRDIFGIAVECLASEDLKLPLRSLGPMTTSGKGR